LKARSRGQKVVACTGVLLAQDALRARELKTGFQGAAPGTTNHPSRQARRGPRFQGRALIQKPPNSEFFRKL
jgi:hypothetical protein